MVCAPRAGVDDHCCWAGGGVCGFLVERDGLFRCALMLEHGSWDRVHTDPRWLAAPIGQSFARFPGFGCGDWPEGMPFYGEPTLGKCCG